MDGRNPSKYPFLLLSSLPLSFSLLSSLILSGPHLIPFLSSFSIFPLLSQILFDFVSPTHCHFPFLLESTRFFWVIPTRNRIYTLRALFLLRGSATCTDKGCVWFSSLECLPMLRQGIIFSICNIFYCVLSLYVL